MHFKINSRLLRRLMGTALFVALPIFTISAPNVCNITDYGAVADSQAVNTIAIQKAIDDCASQGGGKVLVPTGTFLTGTIHLKNNINLHLMAGAVLKGSADIKDYEPYRAPNFPDSTHYGLLYSDQVSNVSITGQGAIDGHERAFFNFKKAKSIEWGGTKHTRQGKNFRKPEKGIGDGPVVPKERPRQMVIFSRSKNVTIRDVQLNKSPFWTLHIAASNGVNISGIQIHASRLTPNSDGIDITSSQDVTISDCDINTGDDAIAIVAYKHMYELPGFHGVNQKTKNVTVANCNLQSSSSGIRIGGEDQNDVENVLVSNVNISNTNRGIGMFLREEGSIKNISFSNMNIQTHFLTGDWWGNGEPIHISAVRKKKDIKLGIIKNVTFRDVNAVGENGILIYGTKESKIQNVKFYNLNFKLTSGRLTDVAGGNIDLRAILNKNKSLFKHDIPLVFGRYVDQLKLVNSELNWGNVKKPYYKRALTLTHFNDVQLRNTSVAASPVHRNLKPVMLQEGHHFSSGLPSTQIDRKNIQQ